MTNHLLGQTFALMAAISWGFAVVLFKLSGDRVSPLALNLFKNAIGILLLAGTLVAMHEGITALKAHSYGDICILIISGVLGIAIADTLFFHALNLVGVGIISIVDCTYSPFTILFSYLLLSEQLTAYHYLGGLLVLAGVMLSSRHTPPADRTRGRLVLGILLGASSMAAMAVAIVFAKPVLESFPLIWAALVRLLFGTAALAAIAAASPKRRQYWAAFQPSSTWLVSVPASILGAYLSMVFWIGGFKYTYASVAALLNQTSVIFALILATVILKESLSRRKLAAATLTLGGVTLMIVFSG